VSKVILCLLLLLSFNISCSRQEDSKGIKYNQAKDEHMHTEELWTCPMHPQIRQDKAGKCPICHMDLVKVGETEVVEENKKVNSTQPMGHASFNLSEARQQLIGVRTGFVEKKPLFKKIEASGKIAFDPELYTAQAEYIEAIKQKERVKKSPIEEVKHSADRMVESAQLRLKVLGLSDQHIRNLARDEGRGSSLLIPKSGENLWVYAEVFEMDLSLIRAGNEAIVSGSALGNKTLKGKVVSVDRVISRETRTAKVRISIQDTKASLRPESFLDVTILSPLGEQMVVPFNAILDTGKEAWVFVVKEKGKFEPRLVTIFERAGDEVAISSGVTSGEKIVTSANFLIDSESRLKGVGVEEKPKTPSCPEGQFWHEQMNHCMDKL
jgi:Cu(I)/Ag(I) efflux system membrane fusion protein